MAFIGSISGSSGTGTTPVTGGLVVTSSGGVTTLTISSDGMLSSSLPWKGNAEGLTGIPSQLETTASFDVTHELTASRTMYVTASTVFISGSPSAGGVGTGSFQVTGSTVMHGQVTGTLIASGTHAGPGSFLAISTLGGFVLATPGGAVTGVNNKSENRLVSIGSTTTELDGEANLTFDGDTLTVAGAVTGSGAVSGHSLAIQAGAVITGSSTHHGALTLENGTLSSSGGATFLGSIFAEDVNVSGTLTAATFSPSSVSGNVAININKPLFANGLNVSGTSVYAANISSSGEAIFGGEVIFSNDVLASASLKIVGDISSAAGNLIVGGGTTISNTLNVSGTTTLAGNLSSSGEAIFGGEVILSNDVLASASLKIVGDISSAAGNLIIGGGTTISNTLNVTGAITTAGNVTSSAAIQAHSLAIQAGATITGSTINHGSLTLQGNLSSSGEAIFGGEVIFSNDILASASLKIVGDISSAAGNLIVGGGTTISNTLNVSGATTTAGNITSSAALQGHSLAIQAGAVITGSSVHHGPVTLQGTLSSSAGAVLLGGLIVNTIEASSSIMAAGAMEVTGNISSSAILKGQQLAIQEGIQVTGSNQFHGSVTIDNGTLSSSAGAVFLGNVIANSTLATSGTITTAGAVSSSKGGMFVGGLITHTLEASSSIMTAGKLTVTGSISGAASIAGHSLTVQAGAAITGSSTHHGALTLHGILSSSHNITLPSDSYVSSSGGATFLQGVIANTIEASSSIFAGGHMEVTGNISSSAIVKGHQLAIQSGFQVTGSSIIHGALTLENGTLSSSGGATFLGSIFAEDVNVSGTLTAATFSPSSVSGNVAININKPLFANGLNVSGTSVYADDISSSAGATFLGTVIANTIEASSSIFAGGHMEVTGNISSSAIVKGHQLAIQNGFQITGSGKLHGPLTIQAGNISCSVGASFLGGIIANTIEASSSIMTAGALTVTGSISGAAGIAGHSLSIQAGATVTGSSINHGPLTLQGTLSSSGGATFLGSIFTEDVNISGNVMMTQQAPDDLGDDTTAIAISEMLKGIATVTPTQNRSKATDTATNIVGGMTNPEPNSSFDFVILNAATGPDKDITMTAGTGVDLVGNMAIRSEDSARFRVRATNVASPAVSIYRIA